MDKIKNFRNKHINISPAKYNNALNIKDTNDRFTYYKTLFDKSTFFKKYSRKFYEDLTLLYKNIASLYIQQINDSIMSLNPKNLTTSKYNNLVDTNKNIVDFVIYFRTYCDIKFGSKREHLNNNNKYCIEIIGIILLLFLIYKVKKYNQRIIK